MPYRKSTVLQLALLALVLTSLLSLALTTGAAASPPELEATGLPQTVEALAQATPLWRDVEEGSLQRLGTPAPLPRQYRLLAVNVAALRSLLAQAPQEGGVQGNPVILPLPLPDGGTARFQIQEYSMMEPGLAAKFPEIKTYYGFGVDEPQATVRLDWTQAGLHALILAPSGTVYLEPYRRGDVVHYLSYHQSDAVQPLLPSLADDVIDGRPPTGVTPRDPIGMATVITSGPILFQYRLAVAANGEYTQYHGGTVNGAMAAIVTTINQLNALYEREISVRFNLVANNNLIIHTNPNTDPYDGSDLGIAIDQNRNSVNALIGSANYDIGHLFGTYGGGLAYLGVVCQNPDKARAASGTSTPEGDSLLRIVAHEMAHQFTADHTFNANNAGACIDNRNAPTAYEPAGGSTLMAYVGICTTQNLQDFADFYFHNTSLVEMSNFIQDTDPEGGYNCAVKTNTGNSAPTTNAGPNYTIPAQTSFTLAGSASDPNGDTLTYAWEQFDLGSPPPNPNQLPNLDGGNRPIFRSYPPFDSLERTFPSLISPTLASLGESLPTTNRALNFRLTARDNKGGVSYDSKVVTSTTTAGPFTLTSPNTDVYWLVSSQQTITWDVANTTAAPVSCSQVDLVYSPDNGQSYVTLVANTPNDGSQVVTIPALTGAIGPVRIKCSNNIFFAQSSASPRVCSSLWQDDHEDGFVDWQVSDGGQQDNPWQAKTDGGYSGDNYWFVEDSDDIFDTDSYLVSPKVIVLAEPIWLSFWHHYLLEGFVNAFSNRGYDAGVVEINVNNQGWQDVGQANFQQNGYNAVVVEDWGSVLAGRPAFSDDSSSYLESVVNLGDLVTVGDTFHIRFRQANDQVSWSVPKTGWFIDDATVCSGSLDDNQLPPFTPYAPFPANAATGVPITPTLTWQGGDADGDVVTYTIAFGQANPPPVIRTQRLTSYTPAALQQDKKYYWRIIASDGVEQSTGPLWSFTTVTSSQSVYLPLLLK